MSKKIKYSLVIISTLIIGMIIGFLVGGMLTRMRVNEMQSYYTQMGFNREFIRLLQPSPEQRDNIIPILRKYGELNHNLMIDFRADQKELFFELKDELSEHLDDQQIQKFNHMWDKKRGTMKNPKLIILVKTEEDLLQIDS